MKGSKRSNKLLTEKRLYALLFLFAFFSSFLLFNIFRLDHLLYDYYRNKTYDQVTTSTVLKAKRGNVYDTNMNLLAESKTVWRIFVSTSDIKKATKESGIDYARLIADGLSIALSMKSEDIYNKITNAKVLDVTIKKTANEEEYQNVLSFISHSSIESLVFTEAKSTRNYPNQTMASHLIGFTGSDSQGLYGLEYYYDDLLAGDDGYYVYAKDAGGRTLDTEYSDYFPATDGYSLITTIDSYIQQELESIIENARINHDVQNRVTGVVMNTKTGAILAMATTSPFDPNAPFVLDELSQDKLASSGLVPGSEEYTKYKNELLQIMWSNKAVSETYEPGSTFKIVTVSAALDLGVASTHSSFSCKGYLEVGGWRIKCHKTTGHGSGFNLAYGLQMSCNPCMMVLAQSVGSDNFYNYVEKFGYFEKSGIDLPSEASTIFHQQQNIGTTELATASFGQRFKVSIINHLRAISAVANGGVLVTPYLVEKVIDTNGNIVSSHQTDNIRQVVSPDVAQTVSQILIDGVNGDGGAKNAGVSGYDIAAKTGTSQKFDILDSNGNSYLRIGSTVAYAPRGDEGIAVIIVVDEPNSTVKYGSVVAAPYVSQLMEKILPYLDYQSSAENITFKVENYVGMNVKSAAKKLSDAGIYYEIVGEGQTILSQTPLTGDVITVGLSKIVLYTEARENDYITVPSLVGLNCVDAIKVAINAGLNIHVCGIGSTNPDANDIIIEQSIPPGEKTKRGSVITIRAINSDFED